MLRLFFISIGVMICIQSFSQDLGQYRWRNRIILISGDTESSVYQKQIQILNQEKFQQPLEERKLLVITNDRNAKQEDFNLKLIGLDGGEKLNSNDFVDPQLIFDLIDSMPMRRSEMKRKSRDY